MAALSTGNTPRERVFSTDLIIREEETRTQSSIEHPQFKRQSIFTGVG